VTVRLLEIAEIELDQAVHWYGAQAPGLGEAFLIEVLSAADRIVRLRAGTVICPENDGARRPQRCWLRPPFSRWLPCRHGRHPPRLRK
jgi:hypothetical protein